MHRVGIHPVAYGSVSRKKNTYELYKMGPGCDMKFEEECDGLSEKLNDLTDGSKLVKVYVSKLRDRAEQEANFSSELDLSEHFLVRFLRARDFDVDLSFKVGMKKLLSKSSKSPQAIFLRFPALLL